MWNVLTLDLVDEEGAEDEDVRKRSPLLEFVVTDNEGSWDKPVEGAWMMHLDVAECGVQEETTRSLSVGSILWIVATLKELISSL